jgi:hypothetical protein
VITGPLAEPEAGLAVAEHTLGPRHLVLRVANVGLRLAVGAARLTVLAPAVAFRGTRSDPNNSSLVLRAEVRGRRILLPGDAEIDAQEDLVRSDADPAELADDERRLRELEQWAAAATATGALSAMVEHPEATQHALAVLQETKSRQQLAELEAWARSQPPRQPEDPTPRQRTQWEQRNAYGTALAAWMANATSCEHRSCLPGACVYR